MDNYIFQIQGSLAEMGMRGIRNVATWVAQWGSAANSIESLENADRAGWIRLSSFQQLRTSTFSCVMVYKCGLWTNDGIGPPYIFFPLESSREWGVMVNSVVTNKHLCFFLTTVKQKQIFLWLLLICPLYRWWLLIGFIYIYIYVQYIILILHGVYS